jgi:hypothetical protein
MAINGITQLQQLRMETNNMKKGLAQDKADAAEERHEDAVQKSYEKMKEEAANTKEAADTQNKANLLGTIFGGFLIGTAIGGAIGGWANDGDEADAREAQKEWKMTDLHIEREQERFDEANKGVDQANKDMQATKKFEEELRDADQRKAEI